MRLRVTLGKERRMLVEGFVGLAAGIVGRFVIPDTGSGGIGGDMLVGVLGGLLGGFTYKLFGNKPPFYDFNDWSVICAAIGAFIFILAARAMTGRQTLV